MIQVKLARHSILWNAVIGDGRRQHADAYLCDVSAASKELQQHKRYQRQVKLFKQENIWLVESVSVSVSYWERKHPNVKEEKEIVCQWAWKETKTKWTLHHALMQKMRQYLLRACKYVPNRVACATSRIFNATRQSVGRVQTRCQTKPNSSQCRMEKLIFIY